MSDIPPRHPNHRPNQQTVPYDPAWEDVVASEWLGHLAAGRVGVRLEASEEVRAIHAANARVFGR